MKFTETHEWLELNDGIAVVGVTEHAQKELGDIVYVELPKPGKHVNAGEEISVLESTKAAADVYSPISGTILEVNEILSEKPELINQSPEANGWLFKIKPTNPIELKHLLDEETYKAKFHEL